MHCSTAGLAHCSLISEQGLILSPQGPQLSGVQAHVICLVLHPVFAEVGWNKTPMPALGCSGFPSGPIGAAPCVPG